MKMRSVASTLGGSLFFYNHPMSMIHIDKLIQFCVSSELFHLLQNIKSLFLPLSLSSRPRRSKLALSKSS